MLPSQVKSSKKQLFTIIDRLKSLENVRFDKEIAVLLDIDYEKRFKSMKQHGRIPYEEINAFCKKNRYDINWVLYGEGEKGYSETETVFIKKDDEIETILDRMKKYSEINSDYGIAKLLGVSQSTLRGWRERNQIPYKQIRKYCDTNSLNNDYFIKGEGHPEINRPTYRPNTNGDLIPVLGITEVGKDINIFDGGYPPGISTEWIRCPYGARDPMALGIRIEGDSMSPKYDHGQTVIVSPTAKVHSKDKVFVVLQDKKAMICQIYFKGDQVTLKKFNADDIEIKRSDIKKMFKIVCAKEL